MTHPTFDDCCTPFMRGPTPSGRMQWHHSFACKVSPNAPIERKPSRAEVASHAETEDRAHNWNRCRIPNCETCAYVEAHMDDADDGRQG